MELSATSHDVGSTSDVELMLLQSYLQKLEGMSGMLKCLILPTHTEITRL